MHIYLARSKLFSSRNCHISGELKINRLKPMSDFTTAAQRLFVQMRVIVAVGSSPCNRFATMHFQHKKGGGAVTFIIVARVSE